MPDTGHVIDVVRHLRAAHASYLRMVESGFDRSREANLEIQQGTMAEEGKQAASVWLDFLDGLHEAKRDWRDEDDLP